MYNLSMNQICKESEQEKYIWNQISKITLEKTSCEYQLINYKFYGRLCTYKSFDIITANIQHLTKSDWILVSPKKKKKLQFIVERGNKSDS